MRHLIEDVNRTDESFRPPFKTWVRYLRIQFLENTPRVGIIVTKCRKWEFIFNNGDVFAAVV